MTDNSILRYPKSSGVMGLALLTRGVEYGLMAAGATVAAIAIMQSLGIVLSWI